jgi:acyl-CoA reductase-like NAD-dependent aldehyde dehydrogenase
MALLYREGAKDAKGIEAFTSSAVLASRRILHAFARTEVGGLAVNDVPGFRVDHAPYGGVKASGQGREGVRYAIEEMTELKLLVFNET